ncbi:MAG TPA: glycosyl hydrolase family 79 C-terminal domain-containing protein, partial [Solirubrobacteraceae bacterium]|nr:glycosyl hydrolase family 79 C-terminal domain-containing protein [Solirubrobacteraceae bacterium]
AGVSHSFATALWSLDTLFAMARVGVDGVNMQTAPGSFNELFSVAQANGGWRGSVYPAYYGLMMFAQAAPPGARFVRLTGSPGAQVNAWATRGPDGAVRIVLTNDATAGARTVTIRAPALKGPSTLERLEAPSAAATQGVTLGGQSFGAQTTTGQLAGPSTLTFLKPAAGSYVLTLPPASAALLTLAAK